MSSNSADQADADDWAAGCRTYTRDVLEGLGHSADLLQTDPGAAVRLLDIQLTAEADDPTRLREAERVGLHVLLMAFVAEFLISVHGARWMWLSDQASPVGGRWVVSGFTHPLGQETKPVDVAGLVHQALASPRVGVMALINQAEHESGIRIITG